jgi:hypothetical protein
MGHLWRTLSGHHVEICDTHAVGGYDPFGEHNSYYYLSLFHIFVLKPAPSRIFLPFSHPLRCMSALITAVHPAAKPLRTVKRYGVQDPPIHHRNARYTLQRHLIATFTFTLYIPSCVQYHHISLHSPTMLFCPFRIKSLVNGYTAGGQPMKAQTNMVMKTRRTRAW